MIAPESDTGGVADDTALSERIRSGDRAAENLLVNLYSSRVFAMAIVRVRDREAASELVDDVLMAVVTALRRGTVHDTARLGAFIHGTTLNLIHNQQRVRGRVPRGTPIEDEATTPDLAESCEKDSDMRELQDCVARLPAQARQVLSMSLTEGLKPGEIGARLGISAEVVRQQKSRALKRLREMLDGPSRSAPRGPLSHW